MKREYEAPSLREVGSLTELTQQLYNKVGKKPDLLSHVDPVIVGSIRPI